MKKSLDAKNDLEVYKILKTFLITIERYRVKCFIRSVFHLAFIMFTGINLSLFNSLLTFHK